MTQITDTCPHCDTNLAISEWEIKDGQLNCPSCGWSQPHNPSEF